MIRILNGKILKTKELIDKAISLPVEERVIIIDSLLKSLNPREVEIERKWIDVAKQRLSEIENGNVSGISGEAVFNKIWKKFS